MKEETKRHQFLGFLKKQSKKRNNVKTLNIQYNVKKGGTKKLPMSLKKGGFRKSDFL